MTESILIVDDEHSIRKAFTLLLNDKYLIEAVATGAEAIAFCNSREVDLVLLDIGLPDVNGIHVLKQLKEIQPDMPTVMITAYGDTKMVVEAIRAGAQDYLVKPIDAQELKLTVKNALEACQLKERIRAIQQPKVDHYRLGIVARNSRIRSMVTTAAKVAKSPETPVLIDGESGTGKGVLARAIHYSIEETPGPFITVNCGAIAAELVESELFGYEKGSFTGARTQGNSGRFEAAAGGTLFLDEIGSMSLEAQVKLLGVLEDRKFFRIGGHREIPVRCRIVAATNADLDEQVKQGCFRSDLYYRLNVVRFTMPPLYERTEDILPLTEYFIDLFNRKFGKSFCKISDNARERLLAHSWPGNVRELKNCLERIVLLEEGEILEDVHLSLPESRPNLEKTRSDSLPVDNVIPYEKTVKSLIRVAMTKSQGNVVESARLLQIPVHKLRYRIKKYGMGI
jgi:DNA-binding NtrC family response regulator